MHNRVINYLFHSMTDINVSQAYASKLKKYISLILLTLLFRWFTIFFVLLLVDFLINLSTFFWINKSVNFLKVMVVQSLEVKGWRCVLRARSFVSSLRLTQWAGYYWEASHAFVWIPLLRCLMILIMQGNLPEQSNISMSDNFVWYR